MFNIFKNYDCLLFDFDKTIATLPINWSQERKDLFILQIKILMFLSKVV